MLVYGVSITCMNQELINKVKPYLPWAIAILVVLFVVQGFTLWRMKDGEESPITEEELLEEEPTEEITTEITPSPEDIALSTEPWNAGLVSQSSKELSLPPQTTATLSATFKNTGTQTWNTKTVSLNIEPRTQVPSPLYHTSWLTQRRPVALLEKEVGRGEQGTFTFSIQTPLAPGTYEVSFWPVHQEGAYFKPVGGVPNLSWTITVQE